MISNCYLKKILNYQKQDYCEFTSLAYYKLLQKEAKKIQ
ncbi:unnamed protein product [Brugia timori]|uniref:Uncharacterized protein n=1 Tax=Brugia timori TaxID=42155 RepID=A0A0R3QM78_9BILA|nr:unnamed protein product [Brugia timori]